MMLDWSKQGRARVAALTVLGTLVCIAVAFVVDGYSFATGEWRWGSRPANNALIPLILAPPFFYLLLEKMRQLAVAHRELMSVAATDGLTSLLNRRAFAEMVDGYFERIEAAGREERTHTGGMLVLDADHFKAVNDRFGHDSGDNALRMIADAIRANVRETDLVGRLGGEEFGVFMPGQRPDQVSAAAERIRDAVHETRFVARGKRHRLSVSVGGALFAGIRTFTDLFRDADARLYEAKRLGRNRVQIADAAPPARSPVATAH